MQQNGDLMDDVRTITAPALSEAHCRFRARLRRVAIGGFGIGLMVTLLAAFN